MTAIAAIILVFSVITLMIAIGVGPFANDPWYQWHLKFASKERAFRTTTKVLATLLCVACSLIIIGLTPWSN